MDSMSTHACAARVDGKASFPRLKIIVEELKSVEPSATMRFLSRWYVVRLMILSRKTVCD
jgi:hypothetical protein